MKIKRNIPIGIGINLKQNFKYNLKNDSDLIVINLVKHFHIKLL